ncbi:MAG: hypothetical protein FWD89_00900 [Firmicutes bacterium]|nr:hypothetical protein [Bacillota bacterium]
MTIVEQEKLDVLLSGVYQYLFKKYEDDGKRKVFTDGTVDRFMLQSKVTIERDRVPEKSFITVLMAERRKLMDQIRSFLIYRGHNVFKNEPGIPEFLGRNEMEKVAIDEAFHKYPLVGTIYYNFAHVINADEDKWKEAEVEAWEKTAKHLKGHYPTARPANTATIY